MNNITNKISKSTIQHDKENNRIYLMKMHKDDAYDIIDTLEEIVRENKYTKIIAKIPFSSKLLFLKQGYSVEAIVPKFYKGREDGVFVAKYFSIDRLKDKDKEIIKNVLNESIKKNNEKNLCTLSKEFNYRKAEEEDAEAIAEFYKRIFETYPFPIYNPQYILKTMRDNVVYFTIWNGDRLIAVSSSEMDIDNLNVEMTDFGTLSEYRRKGFAVYLLGKMEEEMISRGIKTAYSIARAVSYGMNTTFSKKGYTFAGTLINNTNISGRIESMNVWYKELFK
ncbi:putative beta-lysine N-acetyltransferase [Clostridium pasteurianum]|uniref:Putative beta-lysine N-acetyltransferase n=1 Tax=Clostridium pasteurianum BC1 TaxID=86416 RepID=R4K5W3_CLOPA|nr:putative beta-lysine N-acetyltransferase [Clostridium pasteurianum]AGK98547.1 putative beta-lysine N-acetyltransferase [Clostridium pasteurianum BC1]